MDFIKEKFIQEFSGALSLLLTAEETGKRLANEGFNRLVFVGCGAPHQMMRSVAYWCEKYAEVTDTRVYHAGEFIHLDPAALDARTVVFLGSHSGTTKEVVQAAEFMSAKPCRTLAFTQFPDSPLAKNVSESFAYGSSKQGYFSSLMLVLGFTSAFLAEREHRWQLHDGLMKSLNRFPEALACAKENSMERGRSLAKQLSEKEFLYIIGSGPMFTTAYIFAACFLMEMQWMHAFPLTAAEFFHGPFEVFNEDTLTILLLGEDPSRPEAERVLTFLKKHAVEPITYESNDFAMQGIHAEIRPLLAPFILDAALTNLVEALAEIREHPLTTRRYMGKEDY